MDWVILALFVLVMAAIWILLSRLDRKISPRCPSCLRLGHAGSSGRHYCSECGAEFLLNGSGRVVRSFWEATGQPLSLLVVAVLSLLMGIGSTILSIVLVLGATAQLFLAYRPKKFGAGASAANPECLRG